MCTSVIAGKGATDGRLVLIARNEDFNSNIRNKYLAFRSHLSYYNPNNDNPDVQGKTWVLGNGLQVPVSDKMYSYSAMPDASAYEESTHAIGNLLGNMA